ncbi:MFS transporter [uncultured Flavonifractor sp.]|uniref:MFS transporter n=1 Tax=uncultured Flavonifractor sp. TaxID=1193534 RepID=UPI00260EBFDC|nr:MFS transporter [uncultured Flavonifractor sp.]
MAEKVASKLKGNMWRLIILAIAGSLIYGLPYFRTYYYDAYVAAYNLTNTQMGSLGSMFGVFGMVSYLFGGVVADFFSPKKLISVSLILTGVAGICHLFVTSYSMLLVIYLVWGFTSLFAFWPALVKGIRSLASQNEQGKAYGFMEAGRGVTNAIHLAIALAIINAVSRSSGGGSDITASGLNAGIVFYSAVVIVLGLLVLMFFKDEKGGEKSERFNFKQVVTVIKLPQVWILCVILCCTYVMNMSYSYFNPYATSAFSMAMIGGTIVTIMADYIRPFASVGGGVLADRIGRPKIMVTCFLIMAVGTLAIALFPTMSVPVFVIVCAIIYVGMYCNYGIVFSLMEDGGIPMEVSGTAIGLISTIGYLPEVVCPLAAGTILDTYSELGYKYYFIAVAVMMFIGIGAILVWNLSLKKQKNA